MFGLAVVNELNFLKKKNSSTSLLIYTIFEVVGALEKSMIPCKYIIFPKARRYILLTNLHRNGNGYAETKRFETWNMIFDFFCFGNVLETSINK